MAHHRRSDDPWGGSCSDDGAAQGDFWPLPGRSWRAWGAPRLAVGRQLGVQKPSRAHLDESPKRLWAPKTVQERFFIDFGWIWGRLSSIFERFFIDFCSRGVRRRPKSRFSKRIRVILSARVGSCVVQSLRTARTSFEMTCEHCHHDCEHAASTILSPAWPFSFAASRSNPHLVL